MRVIVIGAAGLFCVCAPVVCGAARPVPLPIEVSLTATQADAPTVVQLHVRNLSKGRLEIRAASFLTAKRRDASASNGTDDEYWAPVDPVLADRATARLLALEPGQEIVMSIDSDKLPWAPARSSVWPSRPLRETLPLGDYDVRCSIDEVGLSSDHHVASEPIRMRLPPQPEETKRD